MEGRRADVGTAVMLWTESLAEDPAGTLPDCDLELASLARFATIADWLEVKDGVLYGWERVEVEDAATGEVETRLGHPGFILGVVEEMAKRKKAGTVPERLRDWLLKKPAYARRCQNCKSPSTLSRMIVLSTCWLNTSINLTFSSITITSALPWLKSSVLQGR